MAAPSRIRWAVELREPSWLHDDVFEVLQRHGAALCVHDLLEDHPFLLTTDWTYVRFHGPDALVRKYYGAYGYRRLRRWVGRLDEVSAPTPDDYPYGPFGEKQRGRYVDSSEQVIRELS